MNGTTQGRTRNPAIVILLSVVTVGVYWLVWMYKAPNELAAATQRRLQAGLWVPLLAIIWGPYVVATLVLAFRISERAAELAQSSEVPTIEHFLQAAEEMYVFQIALGVAIAVYAVIQGIYLYRVTVAAQDVARQAQLGHGPKPVMAVLFNAGWALGQIPVIGLLFSVAAIVLAVIWIVQFQQFLNAFWTRGGGHAAPSGPDPSAGRGWVTDQRPDAGEGAVSTFRPDAAPGEPPKAPAAEAPVQGTASPVSREKSFACPDCRAQIRVNYVPGQRTPVQCPSCGTRGVVR